MKFKKTKIIFLTIIFSGLFGWVKSSQATTINAAGCSVAQIQTAIDAAFDGDIVSVPANSCTWAAGDLIGFQNKNISIIGSGSGPVITHSGTGDNQSVYIRPYAKANWRVSNFTFQGTSIGRVFMISAGDAPGSTYGWRIDHITVNYTGTIGGLYIVGPTWGLIDHWTFSALAGGFILLQADSSADTSWPGSYNATLPLDLGTNKAVYIEDSSIAFTATDELGRAFSDAYLGGGRFAFRHDTLTNGYFYDHWTNDSTINVAKYEIYNNIMTGGPVFIYPSRFESGTGVIFNNQITGYTDKHFYFDERRGAHCAEAGGSPILYCDGTHNWDGNWESSGWPCLGQVGQGCLQSGGCTFGSLGTYNFSSVPIYTWNNGAEASCVTGGACTNTFTPARSSCGTNDDLYIQDTNHVNGYPDYVNSGTTPKPGYTSYTYPHPLQEVSQSDTTPPAAPSGLSVQ